MAINNETRIHKTDTIEQFRQKSNEISLHLGDNGLIDSRILDKTESFTAAASQSLFTSNSLRFELKPSESLDDTANSEALSIGVVKVFKDGTELTQGLGAAQFEVPNFVLNVVCTGSFTVPTEFVEGATLTQTGGFSGVLLSASTTELRFKSVNGTAFNTGQLVQLSGNSAKRIFAANLSSATVQDISFGNIIRLNTATSAGNVIKIVSTNLVDAINEVQDDVGNILSLGSNDKSDIVTSINELETGLRGTRTGLVAADLSGMTADNVVSAILEHEADIGNMTLTGLTATNLSAGLRELRTELGNHSSLVTSATGNVVAAVNEVHADALASVKLASGSSQTLNTDATFTNGNTLTFPSGSTLDIRNGSLLIGSGGTEVQFATAFLALTANDASNSAVNQLGIEVKRAGTSKTRVQWNEQLVSSKPARAWQVIGLADNGTTETTADIVTFYNAQELFSSNTETGLAVTWDSTNQNFDVALTLDPVITLGGDLTGSATLTNLNSATLTATIAAGSVENTMLAGSIAASKLAGSIGNSKLSNSTIIISDGSNTSPVSLGGTLTVQGTSSEVTVAESAGTVTVGLPNDVTIGNDLTVTGDLLVQGDTVTLNTSTLAVEDTLVLMGTSGSEPSTGGFGLETRAFTGTTAPHANAAAGVTGTHSIVYNFATDRWEADGSLLLSAATAGSPKIENNNFEAGDNLNFLEGTGMTLVTQKSGTTHSISYANSDRGSMQVFYRSFDPDVGATATAGVNMGTLRVEGLTGITTRGATDKITFELDNTAVSAGAYGSQFVVPRITVDAQGRLTNVTNQTAISLSALGYSGASNADNYGSFSIKANTGATEAIGSGETITFTDSGATTVTRSGNTIDISSVNTQYSVGDGGLSQNNFTNADHTKLNGIAASANNYSFNINANGLTNENISNGEAVRFNGGGATTVTRSGNTITVSSTDTNTDTNTVTRVKGQSGAPSFNSGDITFNGGGATAVTQSGNTITISSTDTNTDTNTQLTDAQVRGKFSAGANVSITAAGVISATDTNTNTTYTAGNGLTLSGTQFLMSGSYTGTFTASADVVAFSDEKLKDNIQPLDGSKVFDMRGVSFNRNDQDGKLSSGVIAQELEMIAPELIHESEDGTKGVAYGNTVGYLIEAIKLLKAEIEELKIINKGIEK